MADCILRTVAVWVRKAGSALPWIHSNHTL
jgi:hypothetical protein